MMEWSLTAPESWWIGFIVGVALTITGTAVLFIIRDFFRYYVEEEAQEEARRLFNEWKREEKEE